MSKDIISSYFLTEIPEQNIYYFIRSYNNGIVETAEHGIYSSDSITESELKEPVDKFPVYFLTNREAFYYLNKLESKNIYPYEKLIVDITDKILDNGKILRIEFE